MTDGAKTVPCSTCGRATATTGTKRCDRCWELEHRLADYLDDGGAKALAFVQAAARKAELRLAVVARAAALARAASGVHGQGDR